MTPTFIHLHLHTEYSIVDGIIKIDPLMKACAKYNMPAVALTDQNNLFATVKFYQAAVSQGIKPIIGCDILLQPDENNKQPCSLVLLAQNHQGYLNITHLISQAYLHGQHHGVPLIKREWLQEFSSDLIVLSGAKEGDIGRALLAEKPTIAQNYLQEWIKLFGDRFYLELQRTGHAKEESYIEKVLELAERLDVPVVATNKACFLQQEDFDAHEARVCIHQGFTLPDPKRPKAHTTQQYLKTPEEMKVLFADIPEALVNTVEIAKRCNLSLNLGKYYLPNFPIPKDNTIESFFISESEKGLETRLQVLFDAEKLAERRLAYDERLKEELSVINTMGFSGYFLIVADFIRWAKQNGVPVGPGRGSGAGSLVAYVLGITDLDPLQYDLLFERFLNPERVSMPDFDVDFCMEGRDRVIEYVANKYGRDCVSQIITYGTMAAKAVVRDVGRVLAHPYGFVDQIAKLIPFELGITLEKALAQEELLQERYNQEEDVRFLIDLAKKLEGITRNAGKHAGGVVIAPTSLTQFVPLYCEENSTQVVSQFDKDDVESVGLVKFDFLGLRTLTIIDWAINTINERHQLKLDISRIPLEDKKTFELLKACDTTAVFQLESRGMKDLIKRLKPDCFEDIIALVALFRPGPLQSGMVDDFINRKHGLSRVEYPHPDLATILKPTYGVILYQEQVMQIAQVLACYTLGGADLLRRAMGKKKAEEMAKQRQIFIEGAHLRQVDKETAASIFDLMEKFAGYGFNKSHSAAYALISYQTAWIKAHYPAEFMAAVLSSDMDNTDKVVIFYQECKTMKLIVLPPCINYSEYKFVVNLNGEILYGLGAIKGVGQQAAENIAQERKKEAFLDLFDFCRRIDLKKANKRVLEALVKSGAMDVFNADRAVLMASLEIALKLALQVSKDKMQGQLDLFSDLSHQHIPELAAANAWNKDIILQAEKEALGFYLSGHPITRYQAELKKLITARISQLANYLDMPVIICGFITTLRFITTKRGDRMAFVAMDDQTAQIEVAVFSDVLQESKDNLSKDEFIIVEGDISADSYSGGFRMSAKRILGIEQAREAHAKSLLLKIQSETVTPDFIEKLSSVVMPYRFGSFPVCIEYILEQATVRLRLGNDWRVRPIDALLDQLQEFIGEENVLVEYD